jgi:hypothetical protein
MKKSLTIEYDADTGEAIITTETRTFKADGFAIFAGNRKEVYLLPWGYYDSIGNAFKVGATDPRQAELYREFMNRREITAEEAVEKFEGCECVGDGGCVCGNRKIYH